MNFKHITVDLYVLIYILHASKIARRLKINNYIINQIFKFQNSFGLKFEIKNKFIYRIVNNI